MIIVAEALPGLIYAAQLSKKRSLPGCRVHKAHAIPVEFGTTYIKRRRTIGCRPTRVIVLATAIASLRRAEPVPGLNSHAAFPGKAHADKARHHCRATDTSTDADANLGAVAEAGLGNGRQGAEDLCNEKQSVLSGAVFTECSALEQCRSALLKHESRGVSPAQ